MLATTLLLKEGRYNIEQEFSAPDNCVRYQAFDTVGEKAVTIVEVPVRLPKVATSAQREALNASFETQAKALESFSHKAVSTVRDHFIEGGRHYVVTDLVDGLDLDVSMASQKRPFSVSEVVEWADTILDALNTLHVSRPPKFFRALKPSNLVLKADKSVGLLISGSIICGEPASVSSSDESVAYSSLEQLWNGLDAASQKVIINKYDEASERILKQDLDARSDIYSLGATLYYLVTARRPVDVLERSIEIIEANPDPLKSPHQIDPAIPTEVSDVIMKAMEIKREYRFDSAAIMRQVLKTAMVRVREREAEEALEHEEAAALIQQATIERQSTNGNGNVSQAKEVADTPVQQATIEPSANGDQNLSQAKEVADTLIQEATIEQQSDNGIGNVTQPKEDTDAVMAKLREAEEKRLEAERRAAEAEKKLRETEARVTESFNLAELDDDLLGLLAPHTSDSPEGASPRLHTSASPNVASVVDQPVAETVVDEPMAAVVEPVEVSEPAVEAVTESFEVVVEAEEEVELQHELAAPVIVDEPLEEFDADSPVVEAIAVDEVIAAEVEVDEPVVETVDTPVETVEVEETPVETAEVEETPAKAKVVPSFAPAATTSFQPEPKFESYEDATPARSGLPIPALAAVAVVLVLVVVGGYVFLGSSKAEPGAETQTTAPASATQTEEPARTYQPETQAQPETPASAQTESNLVNPDPAGQPQKVAAAGPNQPKAKKPAPAPAKSPVQKKPVTADDLINDN